MIQFFLLLLYLFVGCVLSVPYTYLANGDITNFFLTGWIAPIASLFLFIVYISGKRLKQSSIPLWIFLIYFCLPIILNGISIITRLMGYGTISHYTFLARYPSLVAVPVFLVIYNLIVDFSKEHWIQKHPEPNSNNS